MVLPLRLGEETVRGLLAERHAAWAETVSTLLLRGSDAVWIVLAAGVVYLAAAAAEGLPTARRWAAILLGGSALAEWIGARTGFPFGPYVYTDRFGWRMGGVLPFTIPLAWMIVALAGRYLTLWLKPEASRAQVALGAALAGVLTDANLEPIAWKERGYWLWYPGQVAHSSAFPPVQNYVSWFVLMFLLSYALPPNHALRAPGARLAARRPVLVLGLMNGLFVLVHAARWARHHFAA